MRHSVVRSERGFTLLEMMTVVIIIGVLSTLAVYGVRKYIFSTKTAEAIHMIGSIKSAEEAYKGETFTYAGLGADPKSDPNGINDSGHYYPSGKAPGKYKADWTNTGHQDYPTIWGPLGAVSDSPVIFEYAIAAGAAGTGLAKPTDFTGLDWGPQGTAAPGPWYVVVARADQNGDGTTSCFTSSSLTGEIFKTNEDE